MFEAPRQFKSVAIANADAAAAPQPADLDLGKICSTLWHRRTTILSAAAVALLAAVLFVLVAPHRFTAVTEILIEPADLRAVANEAKPPNPASDTALLQVDSQVRVLTSDTVLRRVVDSEGLAHDPEFTRGPSLLRGLLDQISAALGRRQAAAKPDASLAALNEFRRRVHVKRAERTYVVYIGVSSEEAAKAARLANAVAQAYLDEQTQVRADAARRAEAERAGRRRPGAGVQGKPQHRRRQRPARQRAAACRSEQSTRRGKRPHRGGQSAARSDRGAATVQDRNRRVCRSGAVTDHYRVAQPIRRGDAPRSRANHQPR